MRFADLAPGPAPQLPLAAFEARRRRAAQAIGDGKVLVVSTHPPLTYSNDVEVPFRPQNDFWYLTGFAEPGSVLVLEGGSGASHLFLRGRDPKAEVWTGRRLGVERATTALGVDTAHPIEELSRRLKPMLKRRKAMAAVDDDPGVRRRVLRASPRDIEDGYGPVHELRLRKDAAEMRMLQRAADLGVEAFEHAARQVGPGRSEFEVEASLLWAYKRAGSTGPGYPAIVGCGPNAAVLHYVRNQDRMRQGELLLVDAGCEWGYYNSDITRTFPVGGAFAPLQERLYDLVKDAHDQALHKVRPGVTLREVHDTAALVLAEGLVEMGYIEGRAKAAVQHDRHRRFFMHGTSHFLGLDVHDVGGYGEKGRSRVLEEGMVITVEPGLYFNRDFTDCPREAEGIGIRIEDDVAVTATGHKVLTRKLPTDPSAVAAMMRP